MKKSLMMLVLLLFGFGCASYEDLYPQKDYKILVLRARFGDQLVENRWSQAETAEAFFGTEGIFASKAISVKKYLEEVSNNRWIVSGDVTVDEIDMGLLLSDGTGSQDCNIQGGDGQVPSLQTQEFAVCVMARAFESYLGQPLGSGYNWIGNLNYDHVVVSISGPGQAWLIAGASYLNWVDLFGKKISYVIDTKNKSLQYLPFPPFHVFPTRTVDDWKDIFVAISSHEVMHTLSTNSIGLDGMGHEYALYCEKTNTDGSFTPIAYTNDYINSWCTTTNYRIACESGFNFMPDLSTYHSLMETDGWFLPIFFQLPSDFEQQDEYYGAHISVAAKSATGWIPTDKIKELVPKEKFISKWTFKLSPSAENPYLPGIANHDLGAKIVFGQEISRQFWMEFRLSSIDNEWEFGKYPINSELTNGIQIYKVNSVTDQGKKYLSTFSFDCHPSETTYMPWEFCDASYSLFNRSHQDSLCQPGDKMEFKYLDSNGKEYLTKIEVLDSSLLPGDRWIKVKVVIKDCLFSSITPPEQGEEEYEEMSCQ